MFLYHDGTPGTSVLYDRLKVMGKRENNFFVYDCATHYSNCHSVILHNKIDSVETGRLFDNSFA